MAASQVCAGVNRAMLSMHCNRSHSMKHSESVKLSARTLFMEHTSIALLQLHSQQLAALEG